MSKPAASNRPSLRSSTELRDALRARFGAAVDPEVRARPEGPAVPSGWTRVDAELGGGLRPGQTALVSGDPGAGSLALASAWGREHARRGEPVLVLDPAATSLAQAWVPPEDATAPIWRLAVGEAFGTEGELWPAFDIALRSGAFGLLVLLEPPRAPASVAGRVTRLARERRARLVVTRCALDLAPTRGWEAGDRPAPWPPTFRIRLSAGLVQWVEGPMGAAPSRRQMEGDLLVQAARRRRFERDDDAGARTDRVRPPAFAPDRRPPSGRGGRRRR